MTRYDPFAKSPAKSDATRVAPPRQEEDMLFATGEPVKQGPPADSGWESLDEDVDGLLPNAGTLRDAELFATEILGEETPVPAQKAQPQRATDPATLPRESPKATQPTSTQPKPTQLKSTQAKSTPPTPTQAKPTQPTSTQSTSAPPKQVTPAPRATPVPQVAVRTLPATGTQPPVEQRTKTPLTPIMPMRPTRERHGASKHAPAIVFGLGASIATWLGLMQRNYVLGAIVGCATIVGVVFAWLWKRG
jgi:hypothetical protein